MVTSDRDGSGLTRNWLQIALSMNVAGRGRNFGAAAGPKCGVWARVNTGVQGAESPEAVASFTFERPSLDCQDTTPYV